VLIVEFKDKVLSISHLNNPPLPKIVGLWTSRYPYICTLLTTFNVRSI